MEEEGRVVGARDKNGMEQGAWRKKKARGARLEARGEIVVSY